MSYGYLTTLAALNRCVDRLMGHAVRLTLSVEDAERTGDAEEVRRLREQLQAAERRLRIAERHQELAMRGK